MTTMYETAHDILGELDDIMRRVDEQQVTALCDALCNARLISCHGLGREGLALRSFAMRLMHIGFNPWLAMSPHRRSARATCFC